jgi:hypothetical protein
MDGDVGDPFAVDVDLSPVAQALDVFRPGVGPAAVGDDIFRTHTVSPEVVCRHSRRGRQMSAIAGLSGLTASVQRAGTRCRCAGNRMRFPGRNASAGVREIEPRACCRRNQSVLGEIAS